MNTNKYSIPKVSVVIPVHNSSEYLYQALDSVVNQTLKEIEIIIVNDGNADESLDIINEYASKDCRIVVINRPNRGTGRAINHGISIAKGEYLAGLEPSDFIKPEMYEVLYEKAKTHDVDIIISNYHEFTGAGESFTANAKRFFDTQKWYDKELFPYDFYHNKLSGDYLKGFSWCVVWTSLYKREFLIENNIRWNENVRAYNDNGFWFQTRILAKKIMYADNAYYFSRCDNSENVINHFDKFKTDFFKEQIFIKKFLINKGIWNHLKDFYFKRIFSDYIYFALPKLTYNKIEPFFLKISALLLKHFEQSPHISQNTFNKYEWAMLYKIMNNPLECIQEYRVLFKYEKMLKVLRYN